MEIVFGSIMFFTLIIMILTTYYALKGNHGLYWISTIAIYLFSLLMSFTIGLLTVGFAFVTLSLAIGYTFGWINNRVRLGLFCTIGVLVGFVMVYFIRDDLFFVF